MVEITGINLLLGLAINGIFTGIGVALGTYFVNNHLVQKIEKLGGKLKGDRFKRFAEELEKITKNNTFPLPKGRGIQETR